MSRNKDRAYRMEKDYEETFDGLRMGTLGKVDVRSDIFSIECKERQDMKGLKRLYDWWTQAEKYAGKRKPLLAIHLLSTSYDNDLIVMKRSDFMEVLK
ncbi:MAG: hypothetical protein PHS99_08805 [Candidatus Marinimicrobia bacterium]|nr:hypothetical protein [Candidatus Neomarinimicrobiota bacterium]